MSMFTMQPAEVQRMRNEIIFIICNMMRILRTVQVTSGAGNGGGPQPTNKQSSSSPGDDADDSDDRVSAAQNCATRRHSD